jgi:serine/threonine protein kinase
MSTTTSDSTGPRRVGRYELLEEVGAGGMGVVYRARDPLLDRMVAVKIPLFEGPPELRARRVQRFQREARAIAKVANPHVCAIHDVGEQDGQRFVVMAYLPGPSLAERLKSGGRLEQVGEAMQITQQILAALGAVHAHAIVHRDVKPGNILFDADGKAVLTDFGLARPEEAGGLTSEGVALGTPAYIAPEQAAGELDRVGPAVPRVV